VTLYTVGFNVGGTRLKSGGETQQGKLLAEGVTSSGVILGTKNTTVERKGTAKTQRTPRSHQQHFHMASGTISRGQPTSALTFPVCCLSVLGALGGSSNGLVL